MLAVLLMSCAKQRQADILHQRQEVIKSINEKHGDIVPSVLDNYIVAE